MKLTPVNYLPPRFHFWKDFGAGKRRRIPYYRHWWSIWKKTVARDPPIDNTLKPHQLPPGSRVIDAEDLMSGPIDAMPEQLLKMKSEKIVYDHPWPFNIKIDSLKNRETIRNYNMYSRLYVPHDDCLTLTNSVLHTETMQPIPVPGLELTDENLETVERQYKWACKQDSVLLRGPRTRDFPFINKKKPAQYGIPKERQEAHILSLMNEYSQSVLAKHYHRIGNDDKLNELLSRKILSYPHCAVPFVRDSTKFSLDLTIEIMSTASKPLEPIDSEPEKTRQMQSIDISPRSWKSLLDSSKMYETNWTFTLPQQAFPHTIQVASRIKRAHKHEDEMLARLIVHCFGFTSQYARLIYSQEKLTSRDDHESKQATCILQDPLDPLLNEINDGHILEKPVALQSIGYDGDRKEFYFVRYQLNTLKFNDSDPDRVKNQAWYSGPISDIQEAFTYYLDFQNYDPKSGEQLLSSQSLSN